MNHRHPPPQQSKIPPVSLHHGIAQTAQPGDTAGTSETKLAIQTYFTTAQLPGQDTPIIYNGDRQWARVTLTLTSAGPVAVGQFAQISPVTSGRGQLLQTGVPTRFDVAKGNRIYITATGLNVVNLTIEAYPWLETITGLITSVFGKMGGVVGQVVQSVLPRTPGSKL